MSDILAETKPQIHQSWQNTPELVFVLVQFRLECQPLMLGISINIYIYSTVQNIKVLPPVVNKKAVVILNFHEAGEYYNTYIIERAAGGGREEEPTTIRFV